MQEKKGAIMVPTNLYRTRHEFFNIQMQLPKAPKFIVGLDAGYSGMKVWYERGYFCFPSFVKELTDESLNLFDEKDILYRDNDTGKTYMLGYTAQEMVESGDTNETDSETYDRKRYWNPKFQILCKAAIGLAIMSREKEDKRPIFLETGLPASYLKADSSAMKESLTKPFNFSLKKGNKPWVNINLQITSENIHLMAQPAGALYSALIGKDAKYSADTKKLLFGKTLVADFGGGTADFYGIKNRRIVCCESLLNIGSGEILKRVSKLIMDEYGEDIRSQALQHNLETGYIICLNEETMEQESKPIGELVKQASHEVFLEAMMRSRSITNTFRDYETLIVAGGTGEAWFEDIQQYLAGMKTLQILPSNINATDVPFLYSVARGYYQFRYMSMAK